MHPPSLESAANQTRLLRTHHPPQNGNHPHGTAASRHKKLSRRLGRHWCHSPSRINAGPDLARGLPLVDRSHPPTNSTDSTAVWSRGRGQRQVCQAANAAVGLLEHRPSPSHGNQMSSQGCRRPSSCALRCGRFEWEYRTPLPSGRAKGRPLARWDRPIRDSRSRPASDRQSIPRGSLRCRASQTDWPEAARHAGEPSRTTQSTLQAGSGRTVRSPLECSRWPHERSTYQPNRQTPIVPRWEASIRSLLSR